MADPYGHITSLCIFAKNICDLGQVYQGCRTGNPVGGYTDKLRWKAIDVPDRTFGEPLSRRSPEDEDFKELPKWERCKLEDWGARNAIQIYPHQVHRITDCHSSFGKTEAPDHAASHQSTRPICCCQNETCRRSRHFNAATGSNPSIRCSFSSDGSSHGLRVLPVHSKRRIKRKDR